MGVRMGSPLSNSSIYARVGHLSAIITILPASMAGGWALGYFAVDRFLHTYPWGGIIGTLLGAGAGFYEIVRLLMRDQRENSQ